MFGAAIQLTTDADGHLRLELPRRTYAVLAAVFLLAAAYMASRFGRMAVLELEWPAWAQWAAMAVALAIAALFGQQALWGQALVFDAKRAAILRGKRQVARFADVSHVERLERRATDRFRYWAVRMQRNRGQPILLGRERSDVEADLAAARVATALGKPVKHVVR
jgi:hypothetical protein